LELLFNYRRIAIAAIRSTIIFKRTNYYEDGSIRQENKNKGGELYGKWISNDQSGK